MAGGMLPKYTETVSLGNLTPEQFWALARQAALTLGWQLTHTSAAGFIANANGAEIKLLLPAGEAAQIDGSAAHTTQSKAAVHGLLATMQQLAQSTFPHDLQRDYEKQALLFTPPEKDLLLQPPADKTSAAKDTLGLFLPGKDYFITPILVVLNLVLFIAMVLTGVNLMEPDSASLIRWGANYSPLTLGGQPWRLLTCCFLHIGLIHLLLNMYALVYIGLLLEPYLGKVRFLAVYLLTGIAASVASLWWHEITISAGASGAIFGMYGVFGALLTTNVIDKATRKPLLSSIGVFVVFNLVNGLKGGVDNAAHIGGLLSGIVTGYMLVPGLKKPLAGGLKWGSLAAAALLVLGVSAVLYNRVPAGLALYDRQMKLFGKGEEKALAYYKLPQNTLPTARIAALEDTGIPTWDSNIKLLKDLDAAGLPPVLHTKVEDMLDYCKLRKETYELLLKKEVQSTDTYDAKISELDAQIDQKIKALGGG